MPPASTGSAVTARRRRAALRKARGQAAVHALLVTAPADVRYLSGFRGEDSFLLLGPGWASLITDSRFAEQAEGECGGVEVLVRSGPIFAAVADALRGRKVRSLGVQAEHLTLAGRGRLQAAVGSRRLRELSGVAAELRMVKDDAEVATIRRAVRAAEKGFGELIAAGAKGLVGRSERDVAAELDYRVRQAGAEGPSFETIVAAGPHASLPHYRPGATRLRRGHAVLIDWGARLGGYCSDLTRVIFLDRIPPRFGEMYEAVRLAQAAAIDSIRSGVARRTPDKAARMILRDAGLDELFTHGLGHGIGLDIHEAPSVSRAAGGRLRAGMVVTVEPGVYLPGEGGIRIEDDVLVTPDGVRRLSRLSRDLDAMVLG